MTEAKHEVARYYRDTDDMYEAPDGPYVFFGDYEALQRELTEARAERDSWRGEYGRTWDRLQATLHELEAAHHDLSRHVQICAEQANRIAELERERDASKGLLVSALRDLQSERREVDKALRERDAAYERAAQIVETTLIPLGDQYGGYMTTTDGADVLAKAIRALSQPTPQEGEE